LSHYRSLLSSTDIATIEIHSLSLHDALPIYGGFGIFRKGEQGLFDHNLNTELLESLDLNVPEQTPYQKKPETTGFHIYDDYIHPDRKSTRLNSSHVKISYAVFCLKKKK